MVYYFYLLTNYLYVSVLNWLSLKSLVRDVIFLMLWPGSDVFTDFCRHLLGLLYVHIMPNL